MSKYKGPMTAKELMVRLENDPEYCQRRARKDKKLKQHNEACKRLSKPMLDELREHSYVGDSINDIVNKYAPLPRDLVEMLLQWIERISGTFVEDMSIEARVVQIWVRALAAAKDQFDGQILVKCFERTNSESLKWAVANTVALTKPHSIDDWLTEKLKNEYWGKTLRDLGFN